MVLSPTRRTCSTVIRSSKWSSCLFPSHDSQTYTQFTYKYHLTPILYTHNHNTKTLLPMQLHTDGIIESLTFRVIKIVSYPAIRAHF